MEYSEDETSFIASSAGSDGDKGHNLYCSELSEEMFSDDLENPGYIVQNGRGVYKWAVGNVSNSPFIYPSTILNYISRIF